MFKENFLTYGLKVAVQVVWEFLYFPLWWYTIGFGRFFKGILNFWRNKQAALGFWVWLKNIFVPMYGQHDFAGRAISFFIRVIQIIYRGVAMIFWLLIGLVIALLWLLLPPFLLFALILQLL